MRLVTPDLEEWANTYLSSLSATHENSSDEKIEHLEWLKLELFDQMMRDIKGGNTLPFMDNCSLSTKNFIINRLGKKAQKILSTH